MGCKSDAVFPLFMECSSCIEMVSRLELGFRVYGRCQWVGFG